MLKYLLLVIVIAIGLSDGYKRNSQRRWEYKQPEAMYDDYDDYGYQIYAKDSEGGDNKRPSIFSYWNNFLKRTRLPSWNITNPFSKLFTPYVVKVDFPLGTDPNLDPLRNPNRNRNKKKKTNQQDDYVYVNLQSSNSNSDNPEFFYDPLTQQYYEVQQTDSQDYNPQNNFYATTFNDNDEIVINLDENNAEQDRGEAEEMNSEEKDNDSYSKQSDSIMLGRFNSPAIKKLKTKRLSSGRKAAANYRRSSVPPRWND